MMPVFTFPLPSATDPARVDAWLISRGFVIGDGKFNSFRRFREREHRPRSGIRLTRVHGRADA